MISVIVPTRNSQKLEACLESLRNQKRKPGEIIAVFDSKQDRNVSLARKYRARTVFDKNHTIGSAYHEGAKAAKGDIIAFIDDDCTAPRDWLAKLEKKFKGSVDVLGGEDLLPADSTAFQKAAYQTDLARRLDKAVYGENAKKRLRAANIAFRKNIFATFNFNKKLKGLQEPELLHRLFKAGYKMKFDPQLYVHHNRRNNLKGIFRQIYRNGKAKIELIKLHKDMASFIDIAPFVYILLTLAAVYLSFVYSSSLLYSWLLITLAYFLLKPLSVLAKTGEIKYYPHLLSIVFVREIAYSLGILAGIKGVFKR